MNGHQPTHRARGKQAVFQAVSEALEPRRLFSIALEDGVLYVFGTSAADNITVSLNENAERIIVTQGTMERRYFYAQVGGIQVSARGGNDFVQISQAVTRNAVMFGEGGDDGLHGGGGNDKIYAGDGNDRILGGVGSDQLRGEAGSRYITGGG